MPTEPMPGREDSADVSNALICPFCGKLNRPGELVCSACGVAITQAGKTRLMDLPDIAPNPQNRRLYAGLVGGVKPVIFEIDGNQLTLPVGDQVIVGRCSAAPGSQPDVDLSSFAAEEKGVSRLHIQINHKNALFYVVDLGSLNGTWVNGFSLSPHTERLLRDRDSLRLGRMVIKVKF